MNMDETGQQFSAIGRSVWLGVFAAAWVVLAAPLLAFAGSAVDPSAISRDRIGALDPDCPYLRVTVQSPHGPDEEYQKPLRELLSTALVGVGFVVVDDDESHNWWTSSLVLDNGSESAWSTVVRAVAELRGGGIRYTTTYKQVDGRSVPFSGIHSLRLFHKGEAAEAALRIADGIARDLLPTAHQRCDIAILTAARAADAEAERVRGELVEVMEQVRRAHREGKSNSKALELEVDFQQTQKRGVSTENLTVHPPSQAGAHQLISPPASQSPGQ